MKNLHSREGEWKGPWCDRSRLWTNETREDCNVEDKNDGVFWMTFKDHLKYFDEMHICEYEDFSKYSYIK